MGSLLRERLPWLSLRMSPDAYRHCVCVCVYVCVCVSVSVSVSVSAEACELHLHEMSTDVRDGSIYFRSLRTTEEERGVRGILSAGQHRVRALDQDEITREPACQY